MTSIASGLRPPVINIKGDSVVPPTVVADPGLVDNRIVVEESRTRCEGPCFDVD